jgi:hypothetical protein
VKDKVNPTFKYHITEAQLIISATDGGQISTSKLWSICSEEKTTGACRNAIARQMTQITRSLTRKMIPYRNQHHASKLEIG